MKKFTPTKFEFQVSEYFIGYKSISKQKNQICNSESANKILAPFFEEYHNVREAVFALYLNRANNVIGVLRVSEGSINSCTVDPRLVLKPALELLASSIILAHNHPSGTLKPSMADKEITNQIKNGAKLLDMQLVDHLIFSDEGYISFADEGLL